MSDIDKEISEMKLLVNSRARTVAAEFLQQVGPLSNGVCYDIGAYRSIQLMLCFSLQFD